MQDDVVFGFSVFASFASAQRTKSDVVALNKLRQHGLSLSCTNVVVGVFPTTCFLAYFQFVLELIKSLKYWRFFFFFFFYKRRPTKTSDLCGAMRKLNDIMLSCPLLLWFNGTYLKS